MHIRRVLGYVRDWFEVLDRWTQLARKRVVGLVLLVAILAVFLSLNRFPKLDTVREDLDAVLGPRVECFQGFCIEAENDSTFLARWWSFSTTYLRLVAVGMVFAFTVAGLTEGFLFPGRESTGHRPVRQQGSAGP